jgi:hypothetical protein
VKGYKLAAKVHILPEKKQVINNLFQLKLFQLKVQRRKKSIISAKNWNCKSDS